MRPIDELYDMDSYQDMTDEEIAAILEYKAAILSKQSQNSEIAAALTQSINDAATVNSELAFSMRSEFNSICSAIRGQVGIADREVIAIGQQESKQE